MFILWGSVWALFATVLFGRYIRAVAEGTEVTLTHSRLHDEESRRSHEQGWTGALDKMQRHFLVIEGSSP